MALQKTEAVVLRMHKLGETSKILTLYSKEFGKIKVVAKGSRGLKSRFFGTLEPLNHVSIVYYDKENRDLQLLSQAEIINAHFRIRENLVKYAVGSFFCELIEKSQLSQPNKYLFRSLTQSLTILNDNDGREFIVYLGFMLKFLHLNGFRPHFDKCKKCGGAAFTNRTLFSIVDGSVSCEACNLTNSMSVTVTAETVRYLDQLQHTPLQNMLTLACPSPQSCETLLLSFMQYHIEETRNLKTIAFLKNIVNQNRNQAKNREQL
ncbi:MAG TPA: DNA repair protein RecO [bacterium]|nr:DNA repair protein RecO [bacterium]